MEDITFNEYEERAMSTCMDSSNNFMYMMMNLVGEVGEFASKIAKLIRKNRIRIVDNEISFNKDMEDEEYDEIMNGLEGEHGDMLWQLFGLGTVMGGAGGNADSALENLEKLKARKEIGTISGNGDGIERDVD